MVQRDVGARDRRDRGRCADQGPTGEVLRETALTPQPGLYEVKNQEGHRFCWSASSCRTCRGSDVPAASTTGQPRRVYFSFSTADKRSLTA